MPGVQPLRRLALQSKQSNSFHNFRNNEREAPASNHVWWLLSNPDSGSPVPPNTLLDIEELSEEELDRIKARFELLARKAREESGSGRTEVALPSERVAP